VDNPSSAVRQTGYQALETILNYGWRPYRPPPGEARFEVLSAGVDYGRQAQAVPQA
jgi:hypothetical protein